MAGKEVRAGKAFVEITLRDHLQAGLNRAAARLRAFASVTSSIGAGLTGASAAILGPLAAAVKQFSDTGDAVEKMAARTGLSAEAVSELGHAANLSGTDIGTLETGIRRMQQTVADAAGGLGTAQDALAAVGLSAADLTGLSPDQQLAAIADRMAAIEDPALRTAIAMDIFGRSGTQLLPMMADGAAGLQAMRDQARALGLTISTDTASSAAKLNDALGTMWSSIKALTLNIGAALAPVVTEAANRITAVVASVTKFIQKNKQLVVTIAGVGAAIGLAGGALLAIGGTAAVAAFALSGLASIVGVIGTVMSGIGAVIGALFTPIGLIVAGVMAAAGAWLYFSGVGGEAIRWLQTRFGQLVAFVRKVAGGIGDALMAGDLQLATRILWAAVKVAFFRGVEEVASLWQRIKASAQQAWDGVRSAASQAASWLQRTWASLRETAIEVWQTVLARARTVFAGVVRAASGAFGALRSAIASVAQGVAAPIAGIGRRLIDAASFALSGIKATVGPLAGLFGGAFRAGVSIAARVFGGLVMIVSRVASTILSLWSAAVGTAGQIVSRLVRVVTTVASRIVQIASRAASLFAGPFAELVTRVGQIFSAAVELGGTIFSNLVAIVSRVSASILAALARPLEALRGVWQRVTETARAAWGGLVSLATNVASAIGNAFSTVANVVRTAFASVWQFLASGASQVIAFFGRAMSAIGQAGAAIANGFAATFSQVKNATIETFSAIGKALAEGDFALAAEIAWASIKLAFAQGMAWVTNAWAEFSTGLASIFDGAITTVRQIWNNVSTWIARQMLKLVGMVQSLVAKLAEIDPTGLADKLKTAIDFDVEGTIRVLEEDSQRFNQGIGQAKAARDDERVRAMQQQLVDTEKRLAELREARQQALAKADALAEDDAESPLAAAKAELERALAEAANANKLFDADAAQSQLNLPLDFAGMPKLGGSAGLAGTFNAAIAGMLGRSGDDPGERTADAVESMDEKLTDIRDELKDRPVLAFDT
jgi:phage-related protein